MGWYARKYGLATNHVIAIDLVTADGALCGPRPTTTRRCSGRCAVAAAASASSAPSSCACSRSRPVYAGTLSFGRDRAAEVLRAWNALLPGLPDELTSAAGAPVRRPGVGRS